MKKLLKSIARKIGFDLVSYRPFLELLLEWDIQYILDVGANEGQFATELRRIGFQGHIFSFEPVPKTFRQLEQNAASDSLWYVYNYALGSTCENVEIQVSEDTQLVSLMEPVRDHTFTGKASIEVKRLADWQPPMPIEWGKACLKMDTQGFEMQVLLGADEVLPRLKSVIAELAINLSYQGQPHAEEVIAYLRNRNFNLWTTRRGTWTKNGFQEIERDALFRKIDC
jgi:FkbM family methyltransferase